jgi:hypothetical protein
VNQCDTSALARIRVGRVDFKDCTQKTKVPAALRTHHGCHILLFAVLSTFPYCSRWMKPAKSEKREPNDFAAML